MGWRSAQVYMHTDQDFAGYAHDSVFYGAGPIPPLELWVCCTPVTAPQPLATKHS